MRQLEWEGIKGKTSKLLTPTVTLKEHLVLHRLFYKPRLGSRPEMTWLGRGPTEVGLGVALTGFCHAQRDRRASVAGTSCGRFSCTHCRGYFALTRRANTTLGPWVPIYGPRADVRCPMFPGQEIKQGSSVYRAGILVPRGL